MAELLSVSAKGFLESTKSKTRSGFCVDFQNSVEGIRTWLRVLFFPKGLWTLLVFGKSI